MQPTESSLLATEVPPRPTFLWRRTLVWLPACVLQGVLVAWLAMVAQEYAAPLVIFPLLVGVGLGATTVGMSRIGQVGHRPTLAAGLLLAVLVCVAGQHYIRYRLDVRRTQQDAEAFRKAQQVFGNLAEGDSPVPPDNFWQYLRWQAARGRPLHVAHYVARGGMAWFTWAMDGLLVLVAAAAVVLPAANQPYCNICSTWYHTVRSGRLAVDAGRQLAGLMGVTVPEDISWIRYRLLDCSAGCGPTRLLLFWEDAESEYSVVRFWLTPTGRGRTADLLDQARSGAPVSSSSADEDHPYDHESPPTVDETRLP